MPRKNTHQISFENQHRMRATTSLSLGAQSTQVAEENERDYDRPRTLSVTGILEDVRRQAEKVQQFFAWKTEGNPGK